MRRAALLLTLTFACLKSSTRDDVAPMPPKQQASQQASQQPPAASPGSGSASSTPVVASNVYLSTANGEVPVKVEVVATEAKIERGLMYRQHLPVDAGMLFLMGYQKDWAFWMRNTLIALDMIFIAKDMTIAGIVENAEPKTESLRRVGTPSLYVLEVNGGWSKQHGVVAGAKVRFENVP